MDSRTGRDRTERRGPQTGLVLALAASAGAHAALVPSHAAERPLLLEAAGLTLAVSLLRIPSGSDETLRAVREGAGR